MESQFVTELRRAIAAAQDASLAATAADRPEQAYLHRSRLSALLRLAADHDIDTSTSLDPTVQAALASDRGTESDPHGGNGEAGPAGSGQPGARSTDR